MFWKRWISVAGLQEPRDEYRGVRVRIPTAEIVVDAYTDLDALRKSIGSTYPTTAQSADGSIAYITEPRSNLAGRFDLAEEGTALCDVQSRISLVRGPSHSGYAATAVKASFVYADRCQAYPAHAAVLADGTAIVGEAGAGKTTLATMVALRTGIPPIDEDWSWWSRGLQGVVAETGGPSGILPDLYARVEDQFPAPVRTRVGEWRAKHPAKRIPLEKLFPSIPSCARIVRLVLTTPTPGEDVFDQFARSNYHIPFVFPYGKDAERAICISRSDDRRPFEAQEDWVFDFWRHLLDDVPYMVVDRHDSISENVDKIVLWNPLGSA